MTLIIVKKSKEHINSAFGNWDTPTGKYIRNEQHYKEEMKRHGFITYEEAMDRKRAKEEAQAKERFKVSKPVLSILKSVKDSADKKGNVKLSDRQVDAMKKHGLKTGNPIREKISTITGGK